jgi:hypothetical protein
MNRLGRKSPQKVAWLLPYPPPSMSWTTTNFPRVALARLLQVADCSLQGAYLLPIGQPVISFSSGEIGMQRTGPHVPGLSAPELLWPSSERIASSSTVPTTGLRR